MRHIQRKNDFWTKNANNRCLSKSKNIYWTDVHLCIVKLESGGQQLPVTKKNRSGNSFNLEKNPLFYQKYENYTFLPKSNNAQ